MHMIKPTGFVHDKTFRKCTLPLDFKEFGKNKKEVYEKKRNKIKILLTFPNWRGKLGSYMENKSRVHNYAKKKRTLNYSFSKFLKLFSFLEG